MKPDQRIHLHEVILDAFSVRCAVLRGRRKSLLWDTLAHPDQLFWLTATPQFTVYSHADWDHIWGAKAVESSVIIAHTRCARRFLDEAPQTLHEFRCKDAKHWESVELLAPQITFDNHLRIDLGELTVELHHLPGHTPDSIIAFVPEARTILMGDTIEAPCPCVPQDADLPTWIAHLQRWFECPEVEGVIPSHGPAGSKELISQTISYLQRLENGDSWELSPGVTPFYQQTHAENLANRKASC